MKFTVGQTVKDTETGKTGIIQYFLSPDKAMKHIPGFIWNPTVKQIKAMIRTTSELRLIAIPITRLAHSAPA